MSKRVSEWSRSAASASLTTARSTRAMACSRTSSPAWSAPAGRIEGSRSSSSAWVIQRVGAPRAPSVPLERALAPHVDEPERQHEDEDTHLDEAEHAERAKENRPRVHEHHLDVEHDEEDGREVELHRETAPCGTARRIPALEGGGLPGRGTARAEEHAGGHEHRRHQRPDPERKHHGNALQLHRRDPGQKATYSHSTRADKASAGL